MGLQLSSGAAACRPSWRSWPSWHCGIVGGAGGLEGARAAAATECRRYPLRGAGFFFGAFLGAGFFLGVGFFWGVGGGAAVSRLFTSIFGAMAR